MANQKSYPVHFQPRGLSDAWDSTETFPGACRYLTNLIFDQANPELVVCRPGVGSTLVDFSVIFPDADVISVQIAIGDLVYGMVSSSLYGAFDVPFCWDVSASALVTISGATSSNLPLTQPSSGDWTPPTMAVIGAQIIITHPGYSGLDTSGSFSGSITGSTLTVASPVGVFGIGSNITGVGVPANTIINGFISGTYGRAGVYTLNNAVGTPIGPVAMNATGGDFFGVINIADPLFPYYYSANTGIFGLPSVPVAVVNFNNRAYFACNNQAYYSDVLFPVQMTNAGQALTVGDTTPIHAFSGLPVQTTSAGVVGALIIFKDFQIWQVTGDAAITDSLSINYLSLNIGCVAPRSIVQTPIGTIFIGIDGPYFVSALGQILPLAKDQTKIVQDLQKPFQNIRNPTRAAASYSGSLYRICLDTVIDGKTVTNDYWFDVIVKRWSGPHSFPYDCASQVGNYFVISSRKKGANLWASEYLPSLDSVYNDNGLDLSIFLQSAMLPKTRNINEKQVIESTIELSTQSASLTYTVSAFDDSGSILGSSDITILTPLPIWGGTTWGGTTWASAANQPLTYQIPWDAPLVFKKLSYQVSAVSSYPLAIGVIFSKYIDCGYTNTLALS